MENFNKLKKWLNKENDNIKMFDKETRGLYSICDIKENDIIMEIPKKIHQIWFQGKAEIPPHLLEYHDTWVKLNPKYEILIWDQTKIENLIEEQEGWIKDTYFSYKKI